MLYDRILQQPAPLLILMLGILVYGVARSMAHERSLIYVAAGFSLCGLGLGLQTIMDGEMMRLTAPAVAVLYLGGAIATTSAVAMRAGEGRYRLEFTIAVSLACILCSVWFAYVSPDLLARMFVLNLAVGLVYLSQAPYLWRDRGGLDFWQRMLGCVGLAVGGFHLLRAVYLGVNGMLRGSDNLPAADLAQSLEWRVMLVSLGIISLVFCFVSVLCAVQERFNLLRHERDIDPLTGLLNRRGFHEQALARIEAAPHLTWAIIAGDIDTFKKINDNYGHAIGDETLVRVARIWANAARPRHLAARFGGEEFIMLAANRNMREAHDRAEDMRNMISMTLIPGLPEHVTMSFGISEVFAINGAPTAQALERALAMADACLYRAKANGRNCVVSETATPHRVTVA